VYAYSAQQSALKFNIASLIIIMPIFLLIAGSLHKKYKNRELNPQSGVYRWLTYLMLLVSGLNIIGSLIAIVFRLLDGDYTIAFFLKVLVILVIAGGIFGYYWYDLKRNDYSNRSMTSLLSVVGIAIVVLVAVIGSFFLVESPTESRKIAFDNQRVEDLMMLKNQVENYYYENEALPDDLSDRRFAKIMDPLSRISYDYNKLDESSYEICATFDREINPGELRYRRYPEDNFYYHTAGFQCFEQKIANKNIDVPLGAPIR